MRRKVILFIILCVVIAITGCSHVAITTTLAPATAATKPAAPSSSKDDIVVDTLPFLMQIDGKLYQRTGPMLESGVEVDESLIEGYITELVRYPEENGQSNIAPEGSPYARWSTEEHPDSYIVYCTILDETGWYLFHCVTRN